MTGSDLPSDVTTEAVLDLYAQFLEAHRAVREGELAYSDLVQLLDDWFTGNGFPTVIYAPALNQRRSTT